MAAKTNENPVIYFAKTNFRQKVSSFRNIKTGALKNLKEAFELYLEHGV